MLLIVIIASVSLVTSFFCSTLEACMYSVSRSRIETLRRSGHPRGRHLSHVRQHIEESIAAILTVNTVANTLGAAWAGALVNKIYGEMWLTVFSAIFVAAILFFAEIIPKSLGVRFANTIAPVLALPLRVMILALYPIIRLCVLFTRIWGKGARISHGTEEDIISLAQLVEKTGAIHPHEALWVANALRLDAMSAYDLMTPSPVVARVSAPLTLRDTKMNADHWRFSRLPVCSEDDPDKILGILHRRDVFDALARDEFDKTYADLMHKVEFVDENLPAHKLLDLFLMRRRHLFCVRNDAGFFTGVVTLEDVLECLLGREIVDETDLHEDMQAYARRRREALLDASPRLEQERNEKEL
ncbi:DUF21 domain-containing protein [bacterium]|nr:DUF21 domain-containing protein [bacterium]